MLELNSESVIAFIKLKNRLLKKQLIYKRTGIKPISIEELQHFSHLFHNTTELYTNEEYKKTFYQVMKAIEK